MNDGMMPDRFCAADEAMEREDYQTAFQLLLAGANEGDSDCQVMLAALYQTGIGVERSVMEAERWFLMAAEQNNLQAWNQLEALYSSKEPELKERSGDARKCHDRAEQLIAAADARRKNKS